MKKLLLVTLGLFLAMLVFAPSQGTSAIYAQKMDKKKMKKAGSDSIKASKMEAGGKGATADPNVKEEATDNDPNTPQTVPASRGGGGSKGAGGICSIYLSNNTNYAIQIYINGTYKGLLYGGNDSTLYYTPGSVTVYGKALFTDGSYSYWGPTPYTCGPNQYIDYGFNY